MSIKLMDLLSKAEVDEFVEYVSVVKKVSDKFQEALSYLSSYRVGDARTAFAELIKLENKGENIRVSIEKSISEERLEPSLKESLLILVERIDAIGDSVKEVAREFTIIPFIELPGPVKEGLLKLAKVVGEAVTEFANAADHAARGEYEDALKRISRIIQLEEEADNIETDNRLLIMEYGEEFTSPIQPILVHHLNKALEDASDACARAASTLKILILAYFSQTR